MSVALLPYVDAPAVQRSLNDIYQRNPSEPAPELAFLTSAANTNNVLEYTVSPKNGHQYQAQVIYTPRITEAEATTTLTTDCESGFKMGDLTHTYELDALTGAQHSISFNIADLRKRLELNPEYLGRAIMALMDVVKRKVQTGAATQMAVLGGKFATDGGENASLLSVNNTLKTVKTKYAAALDGGKTNPECLQEIMFSAQNSGFVGKPVVFGLGEIFRYMQLLGSSGEYSAGGLNFLKMYGDLSIPYLPSLRMHNALNPSTGNKFLVVDAGAMHLLQYNKFNDPLSKINQDNLIMDVIYDPETDLGFNYKFYLNPCGEKITIIMSTAYKVVGLPDDMYAGGDRLEGTNGVLTFAITNS